MSAEESLRAFDVPEVCERIGCSRDKFYELVRTGQLKTIKVGRSRKVTEKQLRDFFRDREEEASAA